MADSTDEVGSTGGVDSTGGVGSTGGVDSFCTKGDEFPISFLGAGI